MGNINLKLEVEGEAALIPQFRGVSEAIDDFSDVFRAALKPFRDAEQDNFQNNGGRRKWLPLSEAYFERKAAKTSYFEAIQTERLTSRLYKSLTSDTGDSVVEINAKDAAFGTSVEYAKAQHYGVSARNLPARPLIDLTDRQFETITKAMREAVVGKVKKRTTLRIDADEFLAEPGNFF